MAASHSLPSNLLAHLFCRCDVIRGNLISFVWDAERKKIKKNRTNETPRNWKNEERKMRRKKEVGVILELSSFLVASEDAFAHDTTEALELTAHVDVQFIRPLLVL